MYAAVDYEYEYNHCSISMSMRALSQKPVISIEDLTKSSVGDLSKSINADTDEHRFTRI